MTSSDLSAPNRYVTDHNAEGKAIFNQELSAPLEASVFSGTQIFPIFTTFQSSVDMNNAADIEDFKTRKLAGIGPLNGEGANFIFGDFPPGVKPIMHRTETMDCVVVIAGELELSLDSGETQRVKAGDVVVQRCTMHAWRNLSETKTARILATLIPAKPLKVGEHVMSESFSF